MSRVTTGCTAGASATRDELIVARGRSPAVHARRGAESADPTRDRTTTAAEAGGAKSDPEPPHCPHMVRYSVSGIYYFSFFERILGV